MPIPFPSRRALAVTASAVALALSGCAQTRMTDRAAVGAVADEAPALQAGQLGRALVVPVMGFRAGKPDDAERQAAAERVLRDTVAALPLREAVAPETLLGAPPAEGWAALDEGRFLAAARGAGLDSVLVLRVDDYARIGALSIGPAIPPVTWTTETRVAVQLRALDARSGAVRADLRRTRERGGLYTLRDEQDLPAELAATLQSLIASRE